jgi:hypothetical protein
MAWPLLAAAAPALIGAAASIFGGAQSAKGLRAQNRAAILEAQKNRAFQERMSSTAHQREVTDLRAAGLNPILSGMGGRGASQPSGAMSPIVDEKTAAVATAMQVARAMAEINNIKANTKLTQSKTGAIAPAATIGETVGDVLGSAKTIAKTIDLKNIAETTRSEARTRETRNNPRYKWPTQDHTKNRDRDVQRQTFNTFFQERLAQGDPTKADLDKLETALKSGLMNDEAYWRKYLKTFRSKAK